MNFRENLKAFRIRQGMTQQYLATQISVRAETIGNWERGVRQPSFEYLVKLASTLNISVDTLLGHVQTDYTTRAVDVKADELIRKFKLLDAHGKQLVEMVCNMELERTRPNSKPNIIDLSKEHQRVSSKTAVTRKRYLPYYASPSAAGIAAPLEGNDFEMLLIDDTVPEDADYAVRIAGDSMEPYIEDGDMVYVKETTSLAIGEVGIFCVDGAMYCKQYFLDSENNLLLLSANPARESCNLHISYDSGSSVRCCGKVLLDFTIPLPDYV